MIRQLALAALLVPALAHAAPSGEALFHAGRYAEAQKLLEAKLERDPKALGARLLLGRVYRATGQRELAQAVWNRFYDDYEAGALDKKSARDLMYVAIAGTYLEDWKNANDTFRDAVDADPKGKDGARANIEWARLFLKKYDAAHAEVSLDEALKVLPDDADAHTLMARVKLEQSYDVPAAEKELDLALKKDPRHTAALALRAELLVDDEAWAQALAACDRVFAVNPHDLRGHIIAAAARLLHGDEKGFQKERDEVLAVDSHASAFFDGVADFLVKEHRYLEANQLEEQAIKLDPHDWSAQAALGSNLLRLGDDTGGLAALRRAWQGDPYNVRTYNLLNLFDDVIAKEYTLVPGTPFRFRVKTDEQKIIARYVAPMVQREYKELVARYHFTPKGPLTIELYANPDHYAVRTVGLPGLDALGVTFGRVVTSMSPSLGRFNWGMTLWHEVGHIFSIQLSRSRVPRWFTEGLSEYETARERPEWTRRTHAELYHALASGTLLSVATLNHAFSHARDVSHMVVAYHQAAETVSFLIRRWGFPAALKALELYAADEETPQVIRKVTGLDVAGFDRAFQDDLRARLTAYQGTFFVRASDYSDVDALKARMKAHPHDLQAQGLYALALVQAQKGEEAKKLYDDALATKPDPKKLHEFELAVARVDLLQKNRAGAKLVYGLLIEHGGDGYDARFGLGQIAADEGDLAEAEKELALAKKMDPDRAEPYVELGKLYLKMKREEDGLRELEAAARLDCMDPSIPKLLVEKWAARGRWDKVLEDGQLALYLIPFDAELHLDLARALVARGRKHEALGEIDAARECHPDPPTEAALGKLEKQAGRI
ncbi:MAG TPA: tetratricopeptide repeat protein [Polyangia bacterium]